MPNHVTTILEASGHVLDSLKGSEREVDFNTVIPMPKILDSGDSPCHVVEWAEAAMKGEGARPIMRRTMPTNFSDEDFELLLQYMRAIRETGHSNWHSWSCDNWGTKWNAYEVERKGPECVQFQTAWACAEPVLLALSKKFPKETISYRWADEDFGYNLGWTTLKNGKRVRGQNKSFSRSREGSPEAREFALQVIYDGKVPDHMERNAKGELAYKDEAAS